MGQRRAMKEEETKRIPVASIFRWCLALVLFGSMGGGLMMASTKLQDPQVFPLKVVRVKGNLKHLDRQKLEQEMAAAVREGFFTLDVESVHAKLLQMPWVAKLAVRRVWPDTLLITVKEQVPLARWGSKRLVNVQGESFQPAKNQIPTGLPQLAGPKGTEREMVSRYLVMQPRFEAIGLQIARVEQNSRRAWVIEFTDQSAISLGSQQVEERLARFIRLYPRLKAAGQGKPKQVDLRYTNGFVVHWELDEQDELSAWSADITKRNELG